MNTFDYSEYYEKIAEELPNNCVVAELGSFLGYSSIHLAKSLIKRNKKFKIYLVDNLSFSLVNDYPIKVRRETLLNNIKDYKDIFFIENNTDEASKLFEKHFFDFIYINADYHYQSVRKDIVNWLPKLKKDGILAGYNFDRKINDMYSVKFAVEYHLPIHMIKTYPNSVWEFKNSISPIMTSVRHFKKVPKDYLIYIPYLNNIDLLIKSVYSQKEHFSRIVILNQSKEKLENLLPEEIAIYNVGYMHFTRMQNIAQRFAIYHDIKYLFFQHSDCYVTENVIDKMIEVANNNKNWSVIFTKYDALCCFNVDVLIDIGSWDETFWWYVSDVDFYRRIEREKKYKILNFTECNNSIVHIGSQTLKNLKQDEIDEVNNNHNWAWNHYVHKWGNRPNEENKIIPYNGKP